MDQQYSRFHGEHLLPRCLSKPKGCSCSHTFSQVPTILLHQRALYSSPELKPHRRVILLWRVLAFQMMARQARYLITAEASYQSSVLSLTKCEEYAQTTQCCKANTQCCEGFCHFCVSAVFRPAALLCFMGPKHVLVYTLRSLSGRCAVLPNVTQEVEHP